MSWEIADDLWFATSCYVQCSHFWRFGSVDLTCRSLILALCEDQLGREGCSSERHQPFESGGYRVWGLQNSASPHVQCITESPPFCIPDSALAYKLYYGLVGPEGYFITRKSRAVTQFSRRRCHPSYSLAHVRKIENQNSPRGAQSATPFSGPCCHTEC